MMNSEKFLNKHSLVNKWFAPTVLLLSFAGFIDATYLTISHFRGAILPCNLSGGCEKVTTSVYSTLLGVPVALLGLLFYLAVFILLIAYLDSHREVFWQIIFWLSVIAVCFSAWFVFVQFFILKSLCQYCLLSALISMAIFLIGYFRYRQVWPVDENT